MAAESSRASPAPASRSARSRCFSLRAWAPRRSASATVAALRAPWRSESAIAPATTAAASRTPTPASSVRRRRLTRRWRWGWRRRRPGFPRGRSARAVELRIVLGGPVERRGEPGAAIELGVVALGVAPLPGGADQVLVKVATLGVLGEPVAEARPLAQQRLVGDLGRPLVDGEQAALGEHGEGPGGVLVAVELELVEGDAAADEALRLLVVCAGEAQQHRARPEPLGRSEALVGVLGKARDRAADPAASLIDPVAQAAAVAPLPELDQGRREQRQAAGL